MDQVTPGTPAPIDVVSEETLSFDYPGSDILLRSCDSHDFRVPRIYLTNSSSVLGKLIRDAVDTSNVTNREEKEPLPVIELPETGAILYSLLTFIFPVAPVLPSTTENIMKLLAVAQKYQMDSVMTHVRGAISRHEQHFVLPETALHVYFLAQKYELHEEALLAARSTLRLPMTIEDLGDKINFMPGAYLHELWKYHESVKEELASSLLEFRKFGIPDIVEAKHISRPAPPFGATTPIPRLISELKWLDGYIDSLAQAPHLFDIIEFENARAQHTKNGSLSVGISSQTRRSLWEALAVVVNVAIEKVRGTSMTKRHRDDRYEPYAGRFDSGPREGRTNFRRLKSSNRAIMFEPTRCKSYNSIVGQSQFPSSQIIACPLVSIFQEHALYPNSSHRPSCSPID